MFSASIAIGSAIGYWFGETEKEKMTIGSGSVAVLMMLAYYVSGQKYRKIQIEFGELNPTAAPGRSADQCYACGVKLSQGKDVELSTIGTISFAVQEDLDR